MSKKLETLIVTGASRGIGEATARHFCKKGFRVVGIARTSEALNRLQSELGDLFIPKVADLSDLDQSEETIVSLLKDRKLNISGVVLNAGISSGKGFLDSCRSTQNLEMNLNYHSPSIFLRYALKKFSKLPRGRIIAVSSLTALVPFPNNASYAASKAAFYHLLRSIRLEEGFENVEISAVLPGLTDTQMSASYDTVLPRAAPEDVARAVFQCWKKPAFPCVVGRLNQVTESLSRLQPWLFDRVTASIVKWLPHE
jgi:short-subunit dehydrogenase